jgi:hypothetical protein
MDAHKSEEKIRLRCVTGGFLGNRKGIQLPESGPTSGGAALAACGKNENTPVTIDPGYRRRPARTHPLLKGGTSI